ncbi:MAG TPA: hypothetical protein VMD91_11305 [Candidatus Sulfotelmatobacter sp.]|nr:hypothetical protein [Candidatus Sulfotelmatobacter sp.]
MVGVRRWRTFAFALVLLTPLAAFAQPAPDQPRPEYAFDPPEGWAVSSRDAHATVYRIGGGEQRHVIVIATAASSDEAAVAEAMMQTLHADTKDVVDEGAATVCGGQAAHRWSAIGRIEDRPVRVHLVLAPVTGGLAGVEYLHAPGVADRADAMAALDTICPAPFAFPAIAGWAASTSSPAGIFVLRAPDGASSLYGSYRRLRADRFPSVFHTDPRAVVVRSWSEPCGVGQLLRFSLRRDSTLLEVAQGYERGYAYAFTYERTAPAADPAAMAVLTSICQPTTVHD